MVIDVTSSAILPRHVMQDLRISAQSYPMNLAETASTFAELIVSSAAIEAARDPEERRVLLANRLDDAVAYLMNLPARFLFESRFYAERAKGQLTPGELNALMEQAQREAYADSLAVYHPYFWVGLLPLTSQPFCNFPYTFGHLFSAACTRMKAEGPALRPVCGYGYGQQGRRGRSRSIWAKTTDDALTRA